MPIQVKNKGECWVVAYRGRIVAEARSQDHAQSLARKAVERLVAKHD